MSFVCPEILLTGVFDMSLVFPNIKHTKSRVVNCFEIELPIKSTGYAYINDKRIEISNSRILVAKPGSLRHSPNPYICYYIHLADESGEIHDMLFSLPDIIEVSDSEQYRSRYIDIIKAFNSTSAEKNLVMYSKTLSIINMLVKTQNKINRDLHYKSDIIIHAITFLNKNYAQDITLKDVAEYVNLSPIYFRELFVSETGVSPHQYLTNKRIERAKEKLLAGCSSMSDIALDCGFSSQSYFNYVFKKEMGQTPKQFKIESNNSYLASKK